MQSQPWLLSQLHTVRFAAITVTNSDRNLSQNPKLPLWQLQSVSSGTHFSLDDTHADSRGENNTSRMQLQLGRKGNKLTTRCDDVQHVRLMLWWCYVNTWGEILHWTINPFPRCRRLQEDESTSEEKHKATLNLLFKSKRVSIMSAFLLCTCPWMSYVRYFIIRGPIHQNMLHRITGGPETLNVLC